MAFVRLDFAERCPQTRNKFQRTLTILTLFFWILTMLITMRWHVADTVPAIMHHFNGNGSIAYGTNIINSTYHTRYSRSAKPTPSPINPFVGFDLFFFCVSKILSSIGVLMKSQEKWNFISLSGWTQNEIKAKWLDGKGRLMRIDDDETFRGVIIIVTADGVWNGVWSIFVVSTHLEDSTVARYRWQPNVDSCWRNIASSPKCIFLSWPPCSRPTR